MSRITQNHKSLRGTFCTGFLATFLLAVLAVNRSSFAQVHDDRLILLPPISLGLTPPFRKVAIKSLSEAQVDELDDYNSQLADLKLDAFDHFRSMTHDNGNWISRKCAHSPSLPDKFFDNDAARGILHFGPLSIPTILKELDNTYRTHVRITTGKGRIVVFARQIFGNPLNPHEASILGLTGDCYIWPPESAANADDSPFDSYTLRYGDLYFVLLGQIVNRDYQCFAISDKFNNVVCSCPFDEELREKIRAIWTSDNPRQLLYESLMLDFSTRCVFDGKSLNVWSGRELLQVGAAQRLLYSFPEESRMTVAQRLRSLDVESEFLIAASNNGLRAHDLIEAVRPFPCQELEVALRQLQANCKDDNVQKILDRIFSEWKSLGKSDIPTN